MALTEQARQPLATVRSRPESDVALVHDYLTQRGGAERVILSLSSVYPDAPVYTSLYDAEATFPEFADVDVRTSPLGRVPGLRRNHRLALPVLAPTFSALYIDAAVTVCSSSGWAHGVRSSGRKVVYCHTPARWLYQSERYLAGRRGGTGAALAVLAPMLRSWDRRAASRVDRYLVNSHVVRQRVADHYGIEAEVLPPPVSFGPQGPVDPDLETDAGFFLCVSRLMPYKNVDAVVAAFADLPGKRLVVVGGGPMADELAATAPPNVRLVGEVSDARLRWLYRSCRAVVAASYEDFGLTPVESASFGKPVAVLRWGGFLDTTTEGETGMFFDEPEPDQIAAAVRRLARTSWDERSLRAHAERFSMERFSDRLRTIVEEEAAAVGHRVSIGAEALVERSA
jgi:glycosyltransferase involved in cell wall biosynthesis